MGKSPPKKYWRHTKVYISLIGGSVRAKIYLTVRKTIRTEVIKINLFFKAGSSDQIVKNISHLGGNAIVQWIKITPGILKGVKNIKNESTKKILLN